MKTFTVLLVGIISLLFVGTFRKKVVSVSGIFIVLWTLSLSLSTLGLFGMNEPSWTVVSLSISSIVIFAICACLKSPRIILPFDGNFKHIGEDSLSDNCWLYILHIVAYIFSFPYLIKSLSIVRTSGIYMVRDNAFRASSEYAPTAVLLLFQTIVQPLFTVTIIMVIVDVVRKKGRFIPILLSSFDVVLYTFLFAGRFMIFETVFFIFFISYDYYGERSILVFIKKHRKVILGGFVGVFFLMAVTLARQSTSIWESIYIYVCGPFSYLSKLLEGNVGTNLYLLGRNQFGFIYNFICMALTCTLGIDYAGSDNIVTNLTYLMIPIGKGISFNSLGTVLHDYITDYGVYLCLFGVFLLGLVGNSLERRASISNSLFTKCAYFYFVYSTVYTIFGSLFRGPSAFVTIVFLFLFTRKGVSRNHASY